MCAHSGRLVANRKLSRNGLGSSERVSDGQKVKLLSLYHRCVIALNSPDGVLETGLLGCLPEKMAAKLACSIAPSTFSGPL